MTEQRVAVRRPRWSEDDQDSLASPPLERPAGKKLAAVAFVVGLTCGPGGCSDRTPSPSSPDAEPGTAGSSGVGPTAAGVGGNMGGVGGTSVTGGTGASAGVASSMAGGPLETDWQLDGTQPLSAVEPGFAEQTHPLEPTELWSPTLVRPFPTNAFWMNLVLGTGEQRINLLPYTVKALPEGLAVGYPAQVVTETSVTTPDETPLVVGSSEALTSHRITAYDDLSVTVSWIADAGTLEAPLVQGMPYATGLYRGLTPRIDTRGTAILNVNGAGTSPVTAQRLEIELNNNQIWHLYASAPLSWSWTSAGLSADGRLDGWVRIAAVPDVSSGTVLDAHAQAIPVGGVVDLSTNDDNGYVRFRWRSSGDGSLLMMALPHHMPRLSGTQLENIVYETIRGPMTGVVGNDWVLTYPLSSISWTAPRQLDGTLTAPLAEALHADADYTPTALDPYFGGKQLAKLARLVLIAREVQEDGLADDWLARLRPLVSAWLTGSNERPLVYDTTWGGVVSADGIADSAADFGQGYYNDHHFHYGYHLYAAAVLAREDPEWIIDHEDNVMWLVRDIANPSVADQYFPRFRNFDWFEGHSWASGLFEFGDNRNQESSSEAVNAWYSVELVGRALDNEDVVQLGRILRAVETVAAQTYWQIPSASDIYRQPFSDRHAVGVLWSTKVDFATFFGANPEYIYGIQMLPFTPATEDLLSPAWVTDAWPEFLSAAATATAEWRGFMLMAHAVVDPVAAASEIQSLTAYDNGNSAANTLYWVGTRSR